jgi:hypothetical protein
MRKKRTADLASVCWQAEFTQSQINADGSRYAEFFMLSRFALNKGS